MGGCKADSESRAAQGRPASLRGYYAERFGGGGSGRRARTKRLKAATAAFVESMAAYSVVCYLLQIKDRHNGNILVAGDGAVVRVDCGSSLPCCSAAAMGLHSRACHARVHA